jgi:hypothetical protein
VIDAVTEFVGRLTTLAAEAEAGSESGTGAVEGLATTTAVDTAAAVQKSEARKKKNTKRIKAGAEAVRDEVVRALAKRDARGFTPLDVALIGWGNGNGGRGKTADRYGSAGEGPSAGERGSYAADNGDDDEGHEEEGPVALALRMLASTVGIAHLPSSVQPAGVSKGRAVEALQKELPQVLANALVVSVLPPNHDDDDDDHKVNDKVDDENGVSSSSSSSSSGSSGSSGSGVTGGSGGSRSGSGGGGSNSLLPGSRGGTGGWDHDTSWATPSTTFATTIDDGGDGSGDGSNVDNNGGGDGNEGRDSSNGGGNGARCDVVELNWSPQVEVAFADGTAVFNHFLAKGRPVVLRGAAVGLPIQKHFEKSAFLNRFVKVPPFPCRHC